MKLKHSLMGAALVLAVPAAATAGPDRLSILLGSEHINATRSFQEFHPGVILTWERNWNYSAGIFYNSYKDVSVFGAIGYDWEVAQDFDIGLFAGVAYYPGDGDQFQYSAGDLVPLAGIQARYKNVFVQYLPADTDTIDGLITFGLTFELD